MNIPKAIEIIEAACNHEERFDEEELWDAQKLGIEALKAWEFMRKHSGRSFDYYLPGETEN